MWVALMAGSIGNKLSNAQWFWQIYIRFIHDDISTINVCGEEIFYDCFQFRSHFEDHVWWNLHTIGFPCDISEYWFSYTARAQTNPRNATINIVGFPFNNKTFPKIIILLNLIRIYMLFHPTPTYMVVC